MGLWQRFTCAGPLGMAGELPEEPAAGVPAPEAELEEALLDGHKLVPVTGITGVPLPETGVPLPGMAVPAGMLVPGADPPEVVAVLDDEVETIGVPVPRVDPPEVEAVPDAAVEIAGVSVPSPVLGITGEPVAAGDCVADAQAERTSVNTINVANTILFFISRLILHF